MCSMLVVIDVYSMIRCLQHTTAVQTCLVALNTDYFSNGEVFIVIGTWNLSLTVSGQCADSLKHKLQQCKVITTIVT